MKTHPFAIGLVIFCTLLTSVGALFFKLAADRLTFSIIEIITNYYIYIGLAIYGIAALFLIIAYKYGELSVLFPFIALSFVWVAILSIIFLSETMTITKWAGIISIVAGVSFVGRGSR